MRWKQLGIIAKCVFGFYAHAKPFRHSSFHGSHHSLFVCAFVLETHQNSEWIYSAAAEATEEGCEVSVNEEGFHRASDAVIHPFGSGTGSIAPQELQCDASSAICHFDLWYRFLKKMWRTFNKRRMMKREIVRIRRCLQNNFHHQPEASSSPR